MQRKLAKVVLQRSDGLTLHWRFESFTTSRGVGSMNRFISGVALASTVVVGSALIALPAQANTVWDVVGLGLDAVITVDGSNNIIKVTGTEGNGGAFPGFVDQISGVLPPPGPIGGGTNADNDNIFIPTGSPTTAYLTGNGFAFGLATQCNSTPGQCLGGVLWADGGGVYTLFTGNWDSIVSGAVTFSETPLPSTWTMMIAGFVGLGFLAFRGAKKRSAALVAA
jgi:hypothetical protein